MFDFDHFFFPSHGKLPLINRSDELNLALIKIGGYLDIQTLVDCEHSSQLCPKAEHLISYIDKIIEETVLPDSVEENLERAIKIIAFHTDLLLRSTTLLKGYPTDRQKGIHRILDYVEHYHYAEVKKYSDEIAGWVPKCKRTVSRQYACYYAFAFYCWNLRKTSHLLIAIAGSIPPMDRQ
ncbi:hypothetical protein OMCYN_01670 [cyanobiont of Ornithocercus magnificus]|nr:hypothetical protein OMCYN_01670 [cyanobiont of Ornithocercus magnificus]